MKQTLSLTAPAPARWEAPTCGARWAVAALTVVLWDTPTEPHGSRDGQIRACVGGEEAVLTGQVRTAVRSWESLNSILGSVTY